MSKDRKTPYLYCALTEAVVNYIVAGALTISILAVLPRFLTLSVVYSISALFFTSLFARFLRDWLPRRRISPEGKTVFITGCDTGFGNLLAQRLDGIGFQVFAGCLFPTGDGAKKLQQSCSNRLHVVGLDVTQDDSVKDAAVFINNNLNKNKLWAVVNNAGINDGGELDWTNLETIKRVMEVNTIGVVRVTKEFLSQLQQSKGRVITVASAAGRYTYPRMVPYCMSKHAAVSFSDGLRLEMYKWGVQVITIEPWAYKTLLSSEDHALNCATKAWEKAPEETKKCYGFNYIERYNNGTRKMINLFAKENLHEVIDCMEEAILAKYPKYDYFPGAISIKFYNWLCDRLPKPIVDFITYRQLREIYC